jgi:hypothetical protein
LIESPHEGKRPLGRSRHKRKGNIKIDLRETALEDVNLNHLVQDWDRWQAVVNTKRTVRFQILTAASMKFRVFWDILPCSQVDVDRCFRGAYCLHHQGDE